MREDGGRNAFSQDDDGRSEKLRKTRKIVRNIVRKMRTIDDDCGDDQIDWLVNYWKIKQLQMDNAPKDVSDNYSYGVGGDFLERGRSWFPRKMKMTNYDCKYNYGFQYGCKYDCIDVCTDCIDCCYNVETDV